jgi:signal transduction histidine kinase
VRVNYRGGPALAWSFASAFRARPGFGKSLQLSELGIDLTLAKHLVELHGGRIAARSAGIGRGSEPSVCLPIPAAT